MQVRDRAEVLLKAAGLQQHHSSKGNPHHQMGCLVKDMQIIPGGNQPILPAHQGS